MFRDTAFNQAIGVWDVSQVTDMSSMFEGADSFNQPLNGWDVSKVKSMYEMLEELKVGSYGDIQTRLFTTLTDDIAAQEYALRCAPPTTTTFRSLRHRQPARS